jgi:hypothetical protein
MQLKKLTIGIVCTLGLTTVPSVANATDFSWWATSGDTTTINGVSVTLNTVDMEHYTSSSIRDLVTKEGIVTFTFSQPIKSFTASFSRFAPTEKVYDFNIPPSATSGHLSLSNGMMIVTSSSSNDYGSGTISWYGLAATTVQFTMGSINETGVGAIALDAFQASFAWTPASQDCKDARADAKSVIKFIQNCKNPAPKGPWVCDPPISHADASACKRACAAVRKAICRHGAYPDPVPADSIYEDCDDCVDFIVNSVAIP